MLLDTSGLLAFLNAADPAHDDAIVFFDTALFRVTHSYVIAELDPLARSRRVPRSLVLGFVERLHAEESVEITFVDRELHLEALELLLDRRDKDWSLCDAVSFVLMRRIGLAEALTTDHHFEQAGFIRLLAS
jgi:predicted nucleic acid-binding protein